MSLTKGGKNHNSQIVRNFMEILNWKFQQKTKNAKVNSLQNKCKFKTQNWCLFVSWWIFPAKSMGCTLFHFAFLLFTRLMYDPAQLHFFVHWNISMKPFFFDDSFSCHKHPVNIRPNLIDFTSTSCVCKVDDMEDFPSSDHSKLIMLLLLKADDGDDKEHWTQHPHQRFWIEFLISLIYFNFVYSQTNRKVVWDGKGKVE